MFGVTPGLPRSYLTGLCNCNMFKPKGRCMHVMAIHLIFEDRWKNQAISHARLSQDLNAAQNVSGDFPWCMLPPLEPRHFGIDDTSTRPDKSEADGIVARFVTRKAGKQVTHADVLAGNAQSPIDLSEEHDSEQPYFYIIF